MDGWRYFKLDPHRDLLIGRVAEKDDITMPELAAELAERGTVVAPSSISRWLIRNGYRFKKLPASGQSRPDVAAACTRRNGKGREATQRTRTQIHVSGFVQS
ncbi:hypothetical protein [Mesorhizobium sp. A556]